MNERAKEPVASALMSVYVKEDPVYFEEALNSIANQTLNNFELVLVRDGELNADLDSVIDFYRKKIIIKEVFVPECRGLNHALNLGLRKCRADIVLRCDSDDINLPERFQVQVSRFRAQPDLVLVGSPVIEFVSSGGTRRPLAVRDVPHRIDDIKKMALYRSPFNHPTVAFRRSKIIELGGYPASRATKMEDYVLWLRVLASGCVVENFTQPLVLFRAGSQMLRRRQGVTYFFDEINLIKEKLKSRVAPWHHIFIVSFFRALSRLLPVVVLRFVYSGGLRRELTSYEIVLFEEKGC